MNQNIKVFSIPGLRNSPPDHWQSIWEAKHQHFERIMQDDWEHPNRDQWVDRINEVLSTKNPAQLVVTAHSVGCAAFVHWYNRFNTPIKGALLVAPSDVEHPDYPTYITGFSPLPLNKLPFKTVVVASSNDHVVSLERAKYFASHWGSDLVVLENAGHIEQNSGFGEWTEGIALLNSLL